jgi:hypothetical protein
MRIDDGKGRGFQAAVDPTNRLKVISVSFPVQQHASYDEGKANQLLGVTTIAGAGTYNVLHLKNNSDTDDMIFTFMRPAVQGLAGGTIGSATYIELAFGGTYSAGGTVVLPVNMNRTSGVVSDITAYTGNPTITGTLVPFDYWHPETVTDNFVYNKNGTVILGKNDTMTVRLITDHTTGQARVRLSYYDYAEGHHA